MQVFYVSLTLPSITPSLSNLRLLLFYFHLMRPNNITADSSYIIAFWGGEISISYFRLEGSLDKHDQLPFLLICLPLGGGKQGGGVSPTAATAAKLILIYSNYKRQLLPAQVKVVQKQKC